MDNVKKRYQITLEVHEHKTLIHCGFISDTILGDSHEEKAKELIPFVIGEFDMLIEAEKRREAQEKKCSIIAKRFVKQKRMATKLRVVK